MVFYTQRVAAGHRKRAAEQKEDQPEERERNTKMIQKNRCRKEILYLIHEDVSLNTREQAVEVVKMAVEYGWKKLALVASHDHPHRACLTFLREVLDTNSGLILYNITILSGAVIWIITVTECMSERITMWMASTRMASAFIGIWP